MENKAIDPLTVCKHTTAGRWKASSIMLVTATRAL